MKVSINIIKINPHSGMVCKAMAKGIERCGDKAVVRTDRDNVMIGFDACVLWGYTPSCQQAIRNCIALGIPWVFLDMGYWRREKHYFKVAVNDRHPTTYLMKKELPADRFNQLGLSIKDWKHNNSGSIIVAGMSHKAAWSWGLGTEQYEKHTLAKLKMMYPEIPLIYRPKPSFMGSTRFPGVGYDKRLPIRSLFEKAMAVVSHHSNVCCDALLEGIPAFAIHGAASAIVNHDLTKLRDYHYPERKVWAQNLAYCQWNLDEMARGECWSYLKDSELLWNKVDA